MIVAQASNDDHQPRRKLASPVARERPKAREVVGTKLLKYVRVGIHRVVVLRRSGARDVKNQPRISVEESCPRIVPSSRRGLVEQATQFGREFLHSSKGRARQGGPGGRADNMIVASGKRNAQHAAAFLCDLRR